MIAIISDIHGNYPALMSVLHSIDNMGIDHIVSLGDVAGYYCMINECCDELRARNITNLMGNHDFYLTSGNFCPRSRSAGDCLEYQRSVVTSENLNWLASSEHKHHVDGLSMVHGGWKDPVDEYMQTLSSDYFAKLEQKLFVSGHTHVQGIWKLKGKVYCNPGSVGQPRDGDPRAAFATWDGKEFELHRVAYDIDVIARQMQHARFPKYFYEGLYTGRRIGNKLSHVTVTEK